MSRLRLGQLPVPVELKRSKASCVFIDNGYFSLSDKPKQEIVAGSRVIILQNKAVVVLAAKRRNYGKS